MRRRLVGEGVILFRLFAGKFARRRTVPSCGHDDVGTRVPDALAGAGLRLATATKVRAELAVGTALAAVPNGNAQRQAVTQFVVRRSPGGAVLREDGLPGV